MVTYNFINSTSVPWNPAVFEPAVIAASVYAGICLMALALFLLRRKTRSIRNRAVFLTSVQCIMTLLVLSVSLFLRFSQYPICFIRMWISNISVSLWALCFLLRCIHLYLKFRFTKIRLLGMIESTDPPQDHLQPDLQMDESQKHTKSLAVNLSKLDLDDVDRRQRSLTWAIDFFVDKWLCRRKIGVNERDMKKILGIQVGCLLVFLVCAQVFTKTHRVFPVIDAGACSYGSLEYAFMFAVVFFILFLVSPVVIVVLSTVKEVYFLAGDLITSASVGLFTAIYYFVYALTTYLTGPWGEFSPVPLVLISNLTSIWIPLILSYREERHQNLVKVSLCIESFMRVLNDPILFESFKKFTAADLSIENALFWEAYQELDRQTKRSVLKHDSRRTSDYKGRFIKVVQKGIATMHHIGPLDPSTSEQPNTLSRRPLLPSPSESVGTVAEKQRQLIPQVQIHQPEESSEGNCGSNSPHPPMNGLSRSTSANPSLPRNVSGALLGTQAVEEESVTLPVHLRVKYQTFFNFYIMVGAVNEVNISFPVRKKLLDKAQTGDWMPGDFDEAKEEIVFNMFYNTYPRWLETREAQINSKVRKNSSQEKTSFDAPVHITIDPAIEKSAPVE